MNISTYVIVDFIYFSILLYNICRWFKTLLKQELTETQTLISFFLDPLSAFLFAGCCFNCNGFKGCVVFLISSMYVVVRMLRRFQFKPLSDKEFKWYSVGDLLAVIAMLI